VRIAGGFWRAGSRGVVPAGIASAPSEPQVPVEERAASRAPASSDSRAPRERSARSIRARLLRWLLPLLVLILGATSVLDYHRAIAPVENAYDLALANEAFAISAHLRANTKAIELDLNEQSVSLLRADMIDSVFFRVIGPDGVTLGGDPDLNGPQYPVGPTFYDGMFRDQPVRGVAYPVATPIGISVVLVAETLGKRNKARRELITSRAVQDLSIVLFALAVVWAAVGGVLRPLEQLAGQVRARSAGDLSALPEQGSPREVLPLIEALNRLFGRIGATQDSQRRFVENAAHQLRTPLAGLKGQVDLAVSEAGTLNTSQASGLSARLGRIREATSRVTHLANQLLTLSRSDRPSHDTASRKNLSLDELVSDTVTAQIDRAIAREQDLGAETRRVAIRAVEWEIRELLSNLIDNAIRYTPIGGQITVRCGAAGKGAFVEVEDSGPGIPREERERVFERFYRVASAPSGGSGLGLAIVREIASLYGASIEIVDPPKGHGTLVRVTFP